MNKFWGHLKTILRHKRFVCKFCFKCGLYRQGITHDLSKFFLSEFIPGVKYYEGSRSPNDGERKEKGYSAAWLHHKGRNRHHWEYWNDFTPIEMPIRYAAEMCCDRIAASRVYRGKDYKQSDAYDYLVKSKTAQAGMHPKTYARLKRWLETARDFGEEECFKAVRKDLRNS